jgi:hypothetical protein
MSRLTSLVPKVLLFAASAIVSALIASVVISATANNAPVSTVGNAPAYLLAGPETPSGSNVPVAFDVQPTGTPSPLPTLTPSELQAAAQALIGAQPAKWVNPTGFPRVAPVSQFDGGPLQSYNCTMASGAMLARLGSGIVTDGSTLRSLQPKQVGGTSLNDLAQALWNGYGVSYRYGLVKLDSLKALLRAGYGAVAQGAYGQVPAPLRLQKDFTGSHAIYLDGYYPGDSAHKIPEAYYVIDPLGRPWAGYEGDWWPAAVVDQFLTSFSGGDRASAMWAYPPGATPPTVINPDVLPMPPDPPSSETPSPSGSPSASGSEMPSASGSVSPSASVAPSPLATPTPAGSIPPYKFPIFAGNQPVSQAVLKEIIQAKTGGVVLTPVFDLCVHDPKPPGCPAGLVATVSLHLQPVALPPPGPAISVLFVDSPTSNTAIVGYTVNPPATSTVQFWQVGVSPSSVQSASAMSTAQIGGQTVVLARLDVVASTEYQFQVVAGSGGQAAVSTVGDFTTGAGVAQFDVSVGTAPSPTLGLGTGFSPYFHVPQGGLAPPIVPVASAGGACSATGSFNGIAFCLDPLTTLKIPSCTKATVSYALDGLAATGVVVRAYPLGGGGGVGGVVEATGPAPSGTLDVGCLASGLTYTVALSAQGDDHGVLAQQTVSVP